MAHIDSDIWTLAAQSVVLFGEVPGMWLPCFHLVLCAPVCGEDRKSQLPALAAWDNAILAIVGTNLLVAFGHSVLSQQWKSDKYLAGAIMPNTQRSREWQKWRNSNSVQPLGKTIWFLLKDWGVELFWTLSSTPLGHRNKGLTYLYNNAHWQIKQSTVAKREKPPKCSPAENCSREMWA